MEYHFTPIERSTCKKTMRQIQNGKENSSWIKQ